MDLACTSQFDLLVRGKEDWLAMTDHTELVVQRIKERLIAQYCPQKIILFGSYAHGESGPDSDLDLLIIKETSDRFVDRWTTVQRILTGTHRSLPVDTLVLTPQEIEQRMAAGDQFIRAIVEEGIVLHAEC